MQLIGNDFQAQHPVKARTASRPVPLLTSTTRQTLLAARQWAAVRLLARSAHWDGTAGGGDDLGLPVMAAGTHACHLALVGDVPALAMPLKPAKLVPAVCREGRVSKPHPQTSLLQDAPSSTSTGGLPLPDAMS